MSVFQFSFLPYPYQRNFTVILLFILLVSRIPAQEALLDSLTLDTLTGFTSLQEALKNPDQVIKLELRKKGLKTFPKEILQFKNLQYLDLSKNKITEIPEDIGKLKSLQYFSIARNNLIEFPFQIGELTNLYYLNANNNDLVGITAGIGTLTKLKNFDLWSNDLEHFPDELQNMKSLKILDLRAILIPDAEQARIQQLLPNTTVYFSPYCKCGQ
ncbi:MAG TPA: leucine-rich repeat domain-containing protein [Bacteroidia bacterium]|jgi:Leucine-rich repeat (LRR) protein|nr:leucine-rich repeat domain-containing protein [Bacteroidia bacterium]